MFLTVNKILRITTKKVHNFRYLWNANVCSDDQSVVLQHEHSGETLHFPSVWLRDNCQCSMCFNQNLYSRVIPWTEFKASILPKSVSWCDDTHLQVEWPGNHKSTFDLSWLRKHSFDETNQKSWLASNYHFGDKVLWNVANFKNIIRYFPYDKVMSSDMELLKWLLTLNTVGIAIVEDMGTDKKEIERLVDRIGYAKRTTYGPLYVVEAKENTTNSAYLSSHLNLHVDLPYYEYIPSINLLHFATQSPEKNEGVNQLVDGLEVCKQLKEYDLNMYNTLATTLVEWTDKGRDAVEEFHHVYRAPVICESASGEVIRLNVSQPQRDSQFCVSLQEANQWYKSMNWFLHLALHPKNMVNLKMKEGDLLSFDNARLLHGRSAFTTQRSIVGAYMDWDIINSKVRVLLTKLGLNNIHCIKW